MEENKLFLLSLFLSFAGISLLFLLSKNVSPSEIGVAEISDEDMGKTVLVKGKAVSFYSRGSFASFLLCSSKCIKVVSFNSERVVSAGAFVSVEGRVSEFGGKMEILADSIEVLKA